MLKKITMIPVIMTTSSDSSALDVKESENSGACYFFRATDNSFFSTDDSIKPSRYILKSMWMKIRMWVPNIIKAETTPLDF